MDLRLMILKIFGPQGSVCPHFGAIYMFVIHTCDEFGTGIREIFLPFQGDF